MNEEQRLNSSLVKEHNPPEKKVEKDYSQYFQSVYVPPSLKEAKKRVLSIGICTTIFKRSKKTRKRRGRLP